MNKHKRHAGRAIRKQRREQQEMLDTVMAVNWDEVVAFMVGAFAEFGRAIVETADAVSRAIAEFVNAYEEAVEQEYRMTHRALTTGREDCSMPANETNEGSIPIL